jgi:hypothetical protein
MSHTELEASEIPVIDISSPSPDVAKEVLHAASTHGFLFIKNDGVTIPPQDIDDMFDLVSTIEFGLSQRCLICLVPAILPIAQRAEIPIRHPL